jgi:hypothetical protein
MAHPMSRFARFPFLSALPKPAVAAASPESENFIMMEPVTVEPVPGVRCRGVTPNPSSAHRTPSHLVARPPDLFHRSSMYSHALQKW